eukprot:scaffold8535_cov83-Skeletonema_dohrnii-CCMP3373.AAC.1
MSMSGNEEDLRRRLMEDHDDMMFQPLSCNANLSVDTCLGPDAVPFSTIVAASDHTPVSAIVQGVAMVATQSSTCWDRPASDAINGDHGDFSHTCENSDSPAWWMVDFGDDNTAVGEVRIVNRQDGWKYRMVGADIEVLDADMSVVASKVVEDGQDIYDFNFDGAIGRHLRIIQRSNNEPLNIAEVEVHRAGVAVATQSSTCWDRPASDAINGDHGDFAHTCEYSDSPAWWMVDFGDDNTAVGEVAIVNRQDGWKYRMVGADIEVLDADMSVVASKVVVDEQ